MSVIAAVQIPQPQSVNPSLYDFYLSKVTGNKRIKIERLHQAEDAYRSLIGDILIRAMACKTTLSTNDSLLFTENAYGKPSLVGMDEFQFNLSHSGRWVTVIYGDAPVGIDVEEIKPIDLDIAERYFTVHEYRELMLRSVREREDHFYRLWTLKESYIKAVGKGLSIPLDSFSIRMLPDGLISAIPDEEARYFFKSFELDPKYKLSACSVSDDLPDTIVRYELEDLREFFIDK